MQLSMQLMESSITQKVSDFVEKYGRFANVDRVRGFLDQFDSADKQEAMTSLIDAGMPTSIVDEAIGLPPATLKKLGLILLGVGLVSGATSAYHGYRRNNESVGWGAAWGLLGFVLPVATPVAALVQGYARRRSS